MAQIVGTARNSAKFGPPRSTPALIPRLPCKLASSSAGKVVSAARAAGLGQDLAPDSVARAARSDSTRGLATVRASRSRASHFFAVSGREHRSERSMPPSPSFDRRRRLHAVLRRTHHGCASRSACARSMQSLVIVIDDLQCFDGADGERALLSLILQSSPSVRWILATRRVPGFDLQRLKLDDALDVAGCHRPGVPARAICELALCYLRAAAVAGRKPPSVVSAPRAGLRA